MNRYFGMHTLEGEWHALLPRYIFLGQRVKDAHILDIGCGNGLGASLLLELGAAKVEGIDHRPAVLELAKMKHAKDNLSFHIMLWEELGFAPNSFDMILCLDPSSPVTDPNLLREIRRVLKPEGEYICAVERQTVKGLETLLPRYGYSNSAEQVHVHQPSQPVPQLGELTNHFQSVHRVVQRPHYGFVFEEARLDEETDKTTEQLTEQVEMSLDRSLSSSEVEMAGVELWICGDDALEPANSRDILLPYYSIVERLISANAQQPQPDQEQTWHFEDEDENPSLQESTGVFTAPRIDDDPTQVRKRPSIDELAAFAPSSGADQTAQLDARLQQLDTLHQRMQSDFDRLLFETRTTLEQRENYLTKLTQSMLEEQKRMARRANINPELQKRATIGHTASYEARINELESAVEVLIEERDALRRQVRTLKEELNDQLRETFERDEPISESELSEPNDASAPSVVQSEDEAQTISATSQVESSTPQDDTSHAPKDLEQDEEDQRNEDDADE